MNVSASRTSPFSMVSTCSPKGLLVAVPPQPATGSSGVRQLGRVQRSPGRDLRNSTLRAPFTCMRFSLRNRVCAEYRPSPRRAGVGRRPRTPPDVCVTRKRAPALNVVVPPQVERVPTRLGSGRCPRQPEAWSGFFHLRLWLKGTSSVQPPGARPESPPPTHRSREPVCPSKPSDRLPTGHRWQLVAASPAAPASSADRSS